MKLFIDKPKYLEILNNHNIRDVDLNLIISCDLGPFFHPTLQTLSQKLLNKAKSEGIILRFIHNKKLKDEAYELSIKQKEIKIQASSFNGAYYGLLTLTELKEQYGKLTERIIKDEPALKIRGFHLDIARGKVPKLETLYEIIDLLSQYRYNFLELYVEGFAFEYKSFPFVYKDKNYLTCEEFLAIQHYANQKFINLVASENGFGHMSEWLKIDQFKHLAMVDGLFEIWGSKRLSSTLDPTNGRSLELVKTMYQDMIPLSNSKYFNMNFDEPYELGHGRSKDLCEKIGKERVFVDYFNKLALEVKRYGKIPLFWGDFIIHNPAAVKLIDKDAILIDWGYTDDYPFREHAQMLNKLKRPFITSPGTSSWSVGSAKLLEMIGSVENAAWAAYENGGLGMIMTDWGDFGHLQYLPFIYPGIIYASSMMWNPIKTHHHSLKEELQSLIKDNTLAEVLLELSLYNMQEDHYRGYSTRLFNPIISAETSLNEKKPVKAFNEKCKNNLLNKNELKNLNLYFKFLSDKLELVQDNSTIKMQLANTLLLLKTLLLVHQFIDYPNNEALEQINKQFKEYLKIHKKLWYLKNKEDGYLVSSSRINVLQNSLSELLIMKEAEHE